MIDWKEISTKCPKAWSTYSKWSTKVMSEEASAAFEDAFMFGMSITQSPTFVRRLYDFFDENGLLVGVYPSCEDDGCDMWINTFEIIIHESESPRILFSETFYMGRVNAESMALTAAFGFLEKKLIS